MKKVTYAILLLALIFSIHPASAQNLTLLGQSAFPGERTTDIWGYTDSAGNEYALVGRESGFSIHDVSTDPANPAELFYIPHATSGWRDVKTWESYAYVTNEDSGGVLVVDMTYLPDSIRYYDWNAGGIFATAHNIFIDENGYAYILGFNGTGGALIADLTNDPYHPVHVGTYFGGYVHDAFVRGDTMWTAEINDGVFKAVNVSNKAFPQVLAVHSTVSNFTHNIWLSDDGKTVFTTDEVSNAFIAAYDVSDLNNITELDRYQFDPGSNTIVHNTFFIDNFLVTSYYRAGVVITDVTHPDNMIEVGHYDTSPNFAGSGFDGCWGVYPYFSSGNIVASDMQEGLFVLAPNYVQACYLEGLVTDSVTGMGIPGATIEFVSTPAAASTNITGDYKTGVADAGTYDIIYSKPGYVSKTVSLTMSNGVVTLQNIELAPAVSFAFTVNVNVLNSVDPVPNAKVQIVNNQFDIEETGNANGVIPIPTFYEGTYDLIVGAWGYREIELKDQVIDQANNSITVNLPVGYYDGFALDLGWTTSGTSAFGGEWARVDPSGTSFPSSPLLNPEDDLQSDIGAKCFVTGDGDEFDFVHGGSVFLVSPKFDPTTYADPYISFHTRLANFNFGGNVGDDSLVASITNGIDTVVLDAIYMTSVNDVDWKLHSYQLSNLLQLTPDMQVIFEAKSPMFTYYELLEVAIDVFRVVDSAAISSVGPIVDANDVRFRIYPNPGDEFVQISYTVPQAGMVRFEIHDLLGNSIDRYETTHATAEEGAYLYHTSQLQPGIYLVKMNFGNATRVKKLVISE